jgi:hypothetical protein
MKRDIKNVFRNVFVASHDQWLLSFHWKSNFYKKTCLSFELSIAFFIFNLFDETLNWILASFLQWNIRHYLDDFVSIFLSKHVSQMKQKKQIYIEIIDVLNVSRNDFKDAIETKMTVFEIEIDSKAFIIRLSNEKLMKIANLTRKTLDETSISLNDMQSLIDFLFFCAQAMRLSRVFLRRLWDFIAYFSTESKHRKRKLSRWIRDDLK